MGKDVTLALRPSPIKHVDIEFSGSSCGRNTLVQL
jgi:hypothetical protein